MTGRFYGASYRGESCTRIPEGRTLVYFPRSFVFFSISARRNYPALELSALLLNPRILTGLFGVSGFLRNAQSHSGLGLFVCVCVWACVLLIQLVLLYYILVYYF